MSKDITWVGIDAHKKTLQIAVFDGRSVVSEWEIAHDVKGVQRLARKLVRLADGGELRCCYEAGPCGYVLKRQLEAAVPELICEVVAPSLIPVKSGDRVKTDRRDAHKLAQYLASGLLTEVHPRSEQDEAVRDLTRYRLAMKQELMRGRHRLSKLLLRRGIHYTAGKKAWTDAYHKWLETLSFDNPVDQVVNTHARRLLVEVSWHYRHRAGVGKTLRERRQGQPTWAIALADKSQQRLCRRYQRLTAAGKAPQRAAVAVARELAGFVWAAMQEGDRQQQLDLARVTPPDSPSSSGSARVQLSRHAPGARPSR